jgi:hypothetical protein
MKNYDYYKFNVLLVFFGTVTGGQARQGKELASLTEPS